jgi:hypothetical protein
MKRMIGAVRVGSMVLMAGSAFAAEVDRREAQQQARIREGARSGELTPRETARLEKKEARIRREVRRDRAENGGRLTPGEKARVDRQENQLSRQIAAEKHDGQRR